MTDVTEQRADARRNRAAILNAAETLLAARGMSTTLDEIARSADVGAGTVYRHFPTKDALFSVVFTRRIDRLTEQVNLALTRDDPASALREFLGFAMADALRNQWLCLAMSEQQQWHENARSCLKERLTGRFAELVERAQAAEAIRNDIDSSVAFAAIPAYVAMVTALGPNPPDQQVEAVEALLWDGLRAAPAPRTKRKSIRNESRPDVEDRNETPGHCRMCGGSLASASTGRPARYCSSACRQRAHRRRAATGTPSG
ncbi:TetR family transcriptional regulator [Stackebrandtia endophytica]|uniref:TetR family transcriptional regulator n=1 Tax=Stackebrandtia endophytica TaxID=1496996 RepID=A0A543AWZ7_9ACTN|nr:TetR/AcrR family transcriptional regulator [Stackebrandtia endophytica]TQL77070.1 TetR family transcriptional regulator [Stackebrandtia endophytica]